MSHLLIPVIFAVLVLSPTVHIHPASQEVPYRQEPLVVQNGDVALAGTLSRPAGEAAVPAVVLITGSGPQNRDQDVFGFKVPPSLHEKPLREGL